MKKLFAIFLVLPALALRAEPTATNAVKISELSVASTPLGMNEIVTVLQGSHARQTTPDDFMLAARSLISNMTNVLGLCITTNVAAASAGIVSNAAAIASTAVAVSNFQATLRALAFTNPVLSNIGGVGTMARASQFDYMSTSAAAAFQTGAQVNSTITNAIATSFTSARTNGVNLRGTNLTYSVATFVEPPGVITTNAGNILYGESYYQLDMSAGSLQVITFTNPVTLNQRCWFRPTNFLAGQSVTVLFINALAGKNASWKMQVDSPPSYFGSAWPYFTPGKRLDLLATNFHASAASYSQQIPPGKSACFNFSAFGTNMTDVFFSVATQL